MAANLGTKYLGLQLRNPLVVASCPLTAELDVLSRLEEFGAAAAVLPSLFEEQINGPPASSGAPRGSGSSDWIESTQYFRELAAYNRGPGVYLKYIGEAKKRVTIPLIASLNVSKQGAWIQTAAQLEQAGADAIEVNIYFVVTDPDISSSQVEDRYLELVQAIRQQIKVPLAVKIGPFFSALPHFAQRLVQAGADGLVIFNRYLQPQISLAPVRAVPHLVLSDANELRLPLRWTAILRGQMTASLAITTGVHSGEDVARSLLVGADAVMIASALYRNGIQHLSVMLAEFEKWLQDNNYQSVDQARGRLSHKNCPDPAAFERANYTKALSRFATGS